MKLQETDPFVGLVFEQTTEGTREWKVEDFLVESKKVPSTSPVRGIFLVSVGLLGDPRVGGKDSGTKTEEWSIEDTGLLVHTDRPS